MHADVGEVLVDRGGSVSGSIGIARASRRLARGNASGPGSGSGADRVVSPKCFSWSNAIVLATVVAAPLCAHAAPAANLVTGVASEATQLLNYAQLFQQALTLGDQLRAMTDALEIARRNVAKLGSGWSGATQDLVRLQALVSQGEHLAYTARDLDSAFAAKHPGYAQYATQRLGPTGMAAKYDQWSRETRDSSKATLRVAGVQSEELATEAGTIRALERAGSTVEGQLQAIQVGHQIAVEQVRQTQKLRQLVMTQMQLEADYRATEQDRADLQRGAMREFTNASPPPPDDGERF